MARSGSTLQYHDTKVFSVTGILGRFQTQGGIHPSLSTNGPQVVNNDNAVKFNGIFQKCYQFTITKTYTLLANFLKQNQSLV
jgi:hypothetical protein